MIATVTRKILSLNTFLWQFNSIKRTLQRTAPHNPYAHHPNPSDNVLLSWLSYVFIHLAISLSRHWAILFWGHTQIADILSLSLKDISKHIIQSSVCFHFFFWFQIHVELSVQILNVHMLSFEESFHVCKPKPLSIYGMLISSRKFPQIPSQLIPASTQPLFPLLLLW
jgi:hypothetical protein